MLHDYYQILGIVPNADAEAIKKAYRRRAKECHPDHGGSHEKMLLVNEAWEILSDPERRRQYDDARSDGSNATAQGAAAADARRARQGATQYPPRWPDFERHVEGVVTRVASVAGKAAAKAAMTAAGKSSAGLAGKAVFRAATPLLLVADGAQFGTEVALAQLGCDGDTAEQVGQAVGMCSSIGIGAAVGSVAGPPGAAVGASVGAVVWFGGEVFGKGVCWLLRSLFA